MDEAEEALRLIQIICTGNDPSDGEGTTPTEVVESVKHTLSKLLKEVSAAHVEGFEHGTKTKIYGMAWSNSHARKVVEGEV